MQLSSYLLAIFLSHPVVVAYFVLVNIVTLFIYGADKLYAGAESWRVRERTLLLLALVGGTVGAILAMRLFRHKTRKDSFLIWLWLILVVQGVIIYYILMLAQPTIQPI